MGSICYAAFRESRIAQPRRHEEAPINSRRTNKISRLISAGAVSSSALPESRVSGTRRHEANETMRVSEGIIKA